MGVVEEKGRSDRELVDIQCGRRIIDALVVSGRLHVTDDLKTIERALDKLFFDITEGDLMHIRHTGMPFPTAHQAIVGMLEAFADDVLGRLN
jgi:hypothetical protein